MCCYIGNFLSFLSLSVVSLHLKKTLRWNNSRNKWIYLFISFSFRGIISKYELFKNQYENSIFLRCCVACTKHLYLVFKIFIPIILRYTPVINIFIVLLYWELFIFLPFSVLPLHLNKNFKIKQFIGCLDLPFMWFSFKAVTSKDELFKNQ